MTLSPTSETNLNNILSALDEQMQIDENAAFQAALKYYTVLSCFGVSGGGSGGSIDVSTLAKEATLEAIKTKILDSIAVTLAPFNLSPDWRILTTGTTTIPAGSCYVYLTVLTGTVTINGLTKTATNGINDILNLESCLPARHPEITIAIPEGASVELIRGF